MLVVDDAKNAADQLKDLLNAEIKVKVFTDSGPLLETLGSTSQVAEKALRQSVAYLKQCLDDKNLDLYAWIEGKEIVADVLTKQGSKRDEVEEIMMGNYCKNALDEKNCVRYRDGDIKIENLTMKAR